VQLLLRTAWWPRQQNVAILPEGGVDGSLHAGVGALAAWQHVKGDPLWQIKLKGQDVVTPETAATHADGSLLSL
jgi:hypothetical protein